MKKTIYLTLWVLMGFVPMYAQQNVWLFLDVCQFMDNQSKPYIETYLSIDGSTVNFVPTENGKLVGVVNVIFTIQKQGADTAYVFADKFNLSSLPIADTTAAARVSTPFRTLKRIQMEKGKYKMRIEAVDINGDKYNPTVAENEFEISPSNADALAFSDLTFTSSFNKATTETPYTKNGFDVVPLNTNGFFIDRQQVGYYVELYNSNRSFTADYFLKIAVKKGDKIYFEYSKTVRKSPSSIDILQGTLDLKKLPSQAYTLEIQAVNDKNQVIQTLTKNFDVFNSAQNKPIELTQDVTGIFNKYKDEELKYYIRTLSNNSSGNEIDMSRGLQTRKQYIDYLYSFFKKRVDAGLGPTVDMLWELHLNKLAYVNQHYKAQRREGWETDRGRILMKYGKPNVLETYPSESTLLPYEIWRYDRMESQSNVIFVFYDPDLATNEYPLLHSSKYGERNNPRWRDFIQGNGRARNTPTLDYEKDNPLDTKLNPND